MESTTCWRDKVGSEFGAQKSALERFRVRFECAKTNRDVVHASAVTSIEQNPKRDHDALVYCCLRMAEPQAE
jgi:hypothetical protein